MDSPAGELLNRAFRIDSKRSRGITFSVHDIDSEEAYTLDLIWAETERYREEKSKQK